MSNEAALVSLRQHNWRVEHSIRAFTVYGAPRLPTDGGQSRIQLAPQPLLRHDEWHMARRHLVCHHIHTWCTASLRSTVLARRGFNDLFGHAKRCHVRFYSSGFAPCCAQSTAGMPGTEKCQLTGQGVPWHRIARDVDPLDRPVCPFPHYP
eukprot:SAG11_NODE_7100_length_1193_cov_2.434186_1_plen_150_part_10